MGKGKESTEGWGEGGKGGKWEERRESEERIA